MRNITLLGDDSLLGLYLGQALRANKDVKLQSLASRDVAISDAKAVRQILRKQDVVVNGIEFADPDEAERNRKEAFRINSDFPRELSHACSNLKIRLIQLSTPYVFDGSKDSKYTERDIPNPINIYGSSKFVAEKEVRAVCPDALVVRIGEVFGSPRQAGHFLHDLFARVKAGEKEISVLDDQLIAPAWGGHVAPLLETLVLGERTGLAHISPDESCTWYEFAQAAMTLADLDPIRIQPAAASLMKLSAARPPNLVMDSFWLRQWTGQSVPGWREGLRAASF